jgi:hypothetical protein
MNEMPHTPPVIPSIPAAIPSPNTDDLPLGKNPEEQTPILNIVAAIEAILRQPRRVMFQLSQPNQTALILAMVAGTFAGGSQLWIAPVKIAGGLLISAFICLPSLYIFSCLSGSHARLTEVFGLLASLLALMTILLIGFAPVAWVFSQSTESVTAMGSLHLIFWLVATYFGVRFIHRGFAHFKGKPAGGLTVWTIIFLLVALQMTTALRPIIGTAPTFMPTEKKFFLSHWADCLENKQGKTRD